MSKHLFLFIWYFLSKHRLSLLLFLTIIIVTAIEICLAPYLLKIIIDQAVRTPESLNLLLHALIWPAIFYILLTVLHNASMRTYDYVCLKLFPALRTEISVAMFNHLSEHSISFFQQNFSGDLANKISNMSDGVESIIKIFNQNILANLVTITIAAIFLATVHLFFAAMLLIWVVVYICNGLLFSKKTTQDARIFSEANSQLSGHIVDSISNIVSAKIFSNTNYESIHVKNTVVGLGEKETTLLQQIMKTHFYQNILYTLLIIALLTGLIYGRIHGFVSIGDFAFILGLSITIAGMVNGLTQALPTLAREIGKCQQALKVIIVPHDIQDAEDAQPLQVTHGEIDFKQVSFAYDKTMLFDKLTVQIPAGQKVGLVGFSGGGKTTFVNLILRLYDIQSGIICIDTQNISLVARDSLIKNIAFIPQHPELFHRSIMDNIRYGDITASDEEVIAAAKLTHCHEFIEKLSEGYQSVVGERGIKLSGGQRQRIAIARAMLKKSPLLILDEATSALDSATEKQIQEALKVVMEHKTSIVIAHRLATIMDMDRILFFKEGMIVEDGTIDELLANREGYFAQFWAMQMEGI